MQGMKITKGRIQNHFAYSWWKYVILILAAVVGWNLIFTTTAYRAPKDKRLDVTFVTYSISDDLLQEIRADILRRYEGSVEDSSVVSIVYTDEDNYYGSMQLMTYVSAGEGDIYLMTKERFDVFAEQGVLVALDEAIDAGALNLQGIDVSWAIRTDEEGRTGVMGIPADALYGFMEYGIDNRDLVLCVMNYSQNQDLAIDWISNVIDATLAPKPERLVEQEEKSGVSDQAISDIPSF